MLHVLRQAEGGRLEEVHMPADKALRGAPPDWSPEGWPDWMPFWQALLQYWQVSRMVEPLSTSLGLCL